MAQNTADNVSVSDANEQPGYVTVAADGGITIGPDGYINRDTIDMFNFHVRRRRGYH